MWQKTVVVARDMVTFLAGLGMFVREGLTDSPNATLLVIYAVIATAPGTFAAAWLGRTTAASEQLTAGPSSSPPSSPSAPPPSSSAS